MYEMFVLSYENDTAISAGWQKVESGNIRSQADIRHSFSVYFGK